MRNEDFTVVLVNPPATGLVQSELSTAVPRHEGLMPPLGLLYLAAALRREVGCRLRLLDAPAEGLDEVGTLEAITRERADLVGLSVLTSNLVAAASLARALRTLHPRLPCCLGGPHVTHFPEETLQLPGVDYVVEGEGEQVLVDLVRMLLADEPRQRPRTPGERRLVGRPVENLDDLPFPSRDLLPSASYSMLLARGRRPTTLLASRGCPYHCTFCSTPRGPYRRRSIASLLAELRHCRDAGYDEFHFLDDTFNADPGFVTDFCTALLDEHLRLRWSFRGRVGQLEDRHFELLRRAGCVRIHFGVEASSKQALASLGKGIELAAIRRTFALARQHRVRTVGYFLLGCPTDRTPADLAATVKFALALRPDYALFNVLVLYPGSRLHDRAVERGLLDPEHWRRFARSPRQDFLPPYWPEWFDRSRLEAMRRQANRRFYLRPGYLATALLRPENYRALPQRLLALRELVVRG
ncbi:MAG: hypothetical protein A2284_07735 [Deltaproteobacteria bacterium RIFOXYA12_FULL_61_11]|nr:MAG: hypothetical protein A2284_07735 [Deltaproteobacteria bacterium RIFOXYA12_FULL_61_11]